MRILAFETSCDETALTLVDFFVSKKGFLPKISILAEKVASQVQAHAPFGGVVPILAAREHEKNLEILFLQLLKASPERATAREFMEKIDLIAVTAGPGLMPCLLVGTAFAKALAYKHKKPLIGVNHLEGHLYSGFLSQELSTCNPQLIFPALALIVSGGHTELVLIHGIGHYQVLGETLDDAAGEAFDKVARLLGLGYPGGILLEKEAQKGNSEAFSFPRPMLKSGDYNFSFAGLKTSVLYALRELEKSQAYKQNKASIRADIAASFQQAVVDTLVAKTKKALRDYKAKALFVGGGVIANTKLRQALERLCQEERLLLLISPKRYCGDNATMIALAGYFNFKTPNQHKWQLLKVNPNLNL